MPTVSKVNDDPRLRPFVQSLETAPLGDDDLIRFRPDDGDNGVAAKVQSSELYDDEARATLRTLLTSPAKETLNCFARRRILLGRRTANVNYFHQAISAYSILSKVNDVPWNTWFLAALLLGEYGNDGDVVNLFGGPATPGGSLCRSLQESIANGGSLEMCHLREVNTTYGTGMVELPLPHDVAARGWLRAPVIDRDDAVYSPKSNLAQLAVDIADGLDQLEGTHTTALEFSRLLTGATPFVPTLGCLHCCAKRGNSTFDVYVAELESASDARRLATEVPDEEGVAASNGTNVVLFLAQPNFDDGADTPIPETATLAALAQDVLSRA